MANKKISDLTAASALTGSELIEVEQSSISKYTTPSGLKTYISPIVQTVLTSSGAATSTASTFPIDNTTPQNTEGASLAALDTAITPTSASNTIRIEFSLNVSFSAGAAAVHKAVAALFKDSGADALTARIVGAYENGQSEFIITGLFEESAASTSARTYKLRYGANGDTVYINSAAGAAVFNGLNVSWMRVSEIVV